MARTKQVKRHKISCESTYLRQILATKRAQAKLVSQTGGIKKPKHWKPGTKALSEIRSYQRGTKLLIKRRPFQKLVRQITEEIRPGLRIQSAALMAIQVRETDWGYKNGIAYWTP